MQPPPLGVAYRWSPCSNVRNVAMRPIALESKMSTLSNDAYDKISIVRSRL